LRGAAGEDLLTFQPFRWTGLRRSDAIALTWGEIDWHAAEINRLTQKRKKRVLLPIPQELLFALEAERDRRQPDLQDRVLLNPGTRKPLSLKRVYERVRALGRRAGAANAHPPRFRDTFAVDMLARGASPYDVAKLLGDTVSTVEKHYAPFVKALRDRARRFMENGEGLEKTSDTIWAQSSGAPRRLQ
jgi:integrase